MTLSLILWNTFTYNNSNSVTCCIHQSGPKIILLWIMMIYHWYINKYIMYTSVYCILYVFKLLYAYSWHMHQHWQITETLSQQRLKCESCAQWVGIRSWHGKPSPKKAPARSWSWRRQEHVAQQPPIFCRKIQRSWGSSWRGLSDMWSKYQIKKW